MEIGQKYNFGQKSEIKMVCMKFWISGLKKFYNFEFDESWRVLVEHKKNEILLKNLCAQSRY